MVTKNANTTIIIITRYCNYTVLVKVNNSKLQQLPWIECYRVITLLLSLAAIRKLETRIKNKTIYWNNQNTQNVNKNK